VPDALGLSTHQRRAFDRLAHDLRRIFDQRLQSFVASGPRSSIVFVSTILPGDLEAVGALVETWHREGVDTPLLLTEDEFRRSLDAFPLEYAAVIHRHALIAGAAPFAGIEVDAQYLRRACEVQAKSHLIHLRQGWIEAAGHREELADLLVGSAEPLRAILANVAVLKGLDGPDPALAGAAATELDQGLVRDILALVDDPEAAPRLIPRLPDYLRAAEDLWAFIDRWQ
jgi:hypothetical protein